MLFLYSLCLSLLFNFYLILKILIFINFTFIIFRILVINKSPFSSFFRFFLKMFKLKNVIVLYKHPIISYKGYYILSIPLFNLRYFPFIITFYSYYLKYHELQFPFIKVLLIKFLFIV